MKHVIHYWLDYVPPQSTIYSIQVNNRYIIRFTDLEKARLYLAKEFNQEFVHFKRAPQALYVELNGVKNNITS